ncbi:MAG: HEAT repeat domain-containing protein [Candidatus Magnetoovum sp. WYHC-5]|nr:HEAT repeat domain-containing protein [Candidatus Magnetoovum sp. WYHC-5]
MENGQPKRTGFLNLIAKALNTSGSVAVKAYDSTASSLDKALHFVVKTTPSVTKTVSKKTANAFTGGLGLMKFKNGTKGVKTQVKDYETKIKDIYYEIGMQQAQGSADTDNIKTLISQIKEYEQEIQRLVALSDKDEKVKEKPSKKAEKTQQKAKSYSNTEIVSLIKTQIEKAVREGIFEDRADKAIFENITNDLLDSDVEVKVLAASELGKLGNPAAVPILVEALKFNNIYLTLEIINSLVNLESHLSVNVFKEKVHDENYKVRISALRGIYKQTSGAECIKHLTNALQDRNPDVRRSAVTYLGWKDSEQAVPGLLQSLQDRDEKIRKASVTALSSIRDKAAVPSLMRMIMDESIEVREKALEALKNITGMNIQVEVLHKSDSELEEQFNKLKEWWQQEQYRAIDIGVNDTKLEQDYKETTVNTAVEQTYDEPLSEEIAESELSYEQNSNKENKILIEES